MLQRQTYYFFARRIQIRLHKKDAAAFVPPPGYYAFGAALAKKDAVHFPRILEKT